MDVKNIIILNDQLTIAKVQENLKEKLNNDNINNKFELTKQHSIDYTEHKHYITHIINNIIKSQNFRKKNWNDKNFRTIFFRHYFENIKYCNNNQCIEYTKGKFNINEIEMTN